MAVIWILRAVTSPMPPPITIAPMISGSDATSCVANVVTTAIVIPIMAVRLPRRLLSGLERPLSARMKQTPAARYARSTQAGCACTAASAILPLPLLVHGEHALSDSETAENIHARQRNPDNPEPLGARTSARCGSDQRAHHDDRRNGIGDAHQRRVERRGHRPNDVIADEAGEHENRQDGNEVHDPSHGVRALLWRLPFHLWRGRGVNLERVRKNTHF